MILTQTTTTFPQTEGPWITEVDDQAMVVVAATTVATMTVTEIVTEKETVTSEAGEMGVMGTMVMIAGMAVDQEEDTLSLEIAIVATEREIAAEVVVAIMVNQLMDKALLTVTEQDMMIVPVDTMCK